MSESHAAQPAACKPRLTALQMARIDEARAAVTAPVAELAEGIDELTGGAS